jgi:hypothetical protein
MTVLVNGCEYLRVTSRDGISALKFHAVDHYVVSISGERGGESLAVVSIPTVLKLLNDLSYSGFIRALIMRCVSVTCQNTKGSESCDEYGK